LHRRKFEEPRKAQIQQVNDERQGGEENQPGKQRQIQEVHVCIRWPLATALIAAAESHISLDRIQIRPLGVHQAVLDLAQVGLASQRIDVSLNVGLVTRADFLRVDLHGLRRFEIDELGSIERRQVQFIGVDDLQEQDFEFAVYELGEGVEERLGVVEKIG